MNEMQELRVALKRTIPIFFTYLFIGIAFGIMMNEAGYGTMLTLASAVFIYAGSMQLAMVPLMVSKASLLTLALMAFFINARHIFYGISMIERFRKMGWRCPYMIFSLTDETYSILCSSDFGEGLDEDRCAFDIALLNHLYWIIGCLAGACAGSLFSFDMQGIGFSATAFFLTVVTDQWRRHRSRQPFVIASLCALTSLLLLGRDYFLIPALASCLLSTVLLRGPFEEKEGSDDE